LKSVVMRGGSFEAVGARCESREGGVEERREDGEKKNGVEPAVGGRRGAGVSKC